MRRILVPLDGSAFAETALDAALLVARAAGAELHLVQVHEWRMPPIDSQIWLEADPELEARMRADEERYLAAIASRCGSHAGIRATAELLDGSVVDALAAYASDADIDLVVMTTHGRGGISRVWLGSIADALVRACDRPILLLRPVEAGDTARPAVAPKRVLVPLDGSEHSEAVLDHAMAMARCFDAHFALLHTLPVLTPGAGSGLRPMAVETTREQRRIANGYMDEIAAGLRRHGFVVDTIVRDHAVPALAILDEAARSPGTLIAMATHGRGGWSRIALGSVADKVLRAAAAPVLLYRPTPAALQLSRRETPGPERERSA
jgi:nucleotide-binding universal stress UspA family protein